MWKKIAPALTGLALALPSMADEGSGMAAKALFYQEPVAMACTGDKCSAAPEEKKPGPGKPEQRSPVPRPPSPPPASNLGVSYHIRMMQPNGTFREVRPDRVFRSGERFQLIVKVNRPSYVYVDNLSPDQQLSQIYPLGRQNNFVGAMGTIVLPENNFFEFDGQPGIEHLYVLVSPTPVASRTPAAPSPGQQAVPISTRCGGDADYAGSKAIGQVSSPGPLQSACTDIGKPDVMARQADFISCTSEPDYAGSKAIGQTGGGTLQPACASVTRSGSHRILAQQENGAGPGQSSDRIYVKQTTAAGVGSDRFLIGIELVHQ